jgi:hypothetical protein
MAGLLLAVFLLAACLPALQAMVTQPKVERMGCVSQLKGAFTFKDRWSTLTTTPETCCSQWWPLTHLVARWNTSGW